MSKKLKLYYGGTATKHLCGKLAMQVVALHPGIHEYDEKKLEEVSDHPDMKKLKNEGLLMTESEYRDSLKKNKPAGKKESAPAAEEPAKASKGLDLDELLSGNVKEVCEMIAAQDDKELLAHLLEAEKSGKKRKGVMDAIEEKLK